MTKDKIMYTEDLFEDGIVKEAHDGIAETVISDSENCRECSVKIYCKPGNSNERCLTVKDPFGAHPGDKVRVAIKGSKILSASFLLYGIPLSILLLGIFIGMERRVGCCGQRDKTRGGRGGRKKATTSEKRRRSYSKAAATPRKRRPSPLEDRFAQLCAEYEWGRYEREKRGLVPGRRFREDFWFPDCQLAVEIDAVGVKRSGHCTPKGVTNDREKDTLLQLRGYHVLRFTTYHFRNDCSYIVKHMDAAIRRWRTT